MVWRLWGGSAFEVGEFFVDVALDLREGALGVIKRDGGFGFLLEAVAKCSGTVAGRLEFFGGFFGFVGYFGLRGGFFRGFLCLRGGFWRCFGGIFLAAG